MCARAVAVSALEALPGFKPLDGCHCISSSLARIFQHAKHPLSEEMILGLGAGVGFVYWRMKFGDQDSVFVGGRANLKNLPGPWQANGSGDSGKADRQFRKGRD
jgi:hypothetical protein